jgi:hypothetical protein
LLCIKSIDSSVTNVYELAYDVTTKKALEYLKIDNFECIITGMQLLKATLILAKRLPIAMATPRVQGLCVMMTELLELCLSKDHRLHSPVFGDDSNVSIMVCSS